MKTLILGGSGSIGFKIVEILSNNKDIDVTVMGRSDKPKNMPENCDYISKNISELNKSFFQKYDCVVNCVGPSYEFYKFLASLAIEANVNYIDLGGYEDVAEIVENKKSLNAYSKTFLATAGVMPGLSEIYLYDIMRKADVKNIEEVNICVGAYEDWSLSSVKDMIWHAIHKMGTGYFFKGEWHSTPLNKSMMKRPIKNFKGEPWCMLHKNDHLINFVKRHKEIKVKSYVGLLDFRVIASIMLASTLLRFTTSLSAKIMQKSLMLSKLKYTSEYTGFMSYTIKFKDKSICTDAVYITDTALATAQCCAVAVQMVANKKVNAGAGFIADNVDITHYMERIQEYDNFDIKKG